MQKFFFIVIFIVGALSVSAQDGGMALSPARFELEMDPGTETTVVVNLDYRGAPGAAQAARIVASLNDWNITQDGRVEYFAAGTRPNSASPWLVYSPGEAPVAPGTVHQIRVTIAVPKDATPGDHLTALVVEQRPESLKGANLRQMIVRYRMASVFYIKVKGLTRKGDLGDLLAESDPDGVVVTPTLRNEGNSVIRPIGSVRVLDTDGKVVAEIPDVAMLPVLASTTLTQKVRIDMPLAPGSYSVRYRVDFQDGGRPTEGVTDLIVRAAVPQIANSGKAPQKP